MNSGLPTFLFWGPDRCGEQTIEAQSGRGSGCKGESINEK